MVKTSSTQLFLGAFPVFPSTDLVNVHQLINCLFSKETSRKRADISLAGWISHFLVNWQKLTLNQDILSVVKGYIIPFFKITFRQKIPNFPRMNEKQIAPVDLELKEMLRKGTIKRTQPVQGEFLSNLSLIGKKRSRLFLCNQSENVESVHFFSPFQNGRPFSIKALNTGILQTGSEVCILQFTIGAKLEKVWRVSCDGDYLRVRMPMFWTRSSTTGIYKVIENSTVIPDKNQLQNDSIFGWYVDVDSHNTRSSIELRHSHISRAKFGFYNKYQNLYTYVTEYNFWE